MNESNDSNRQSCHRLAPEEVTRRRFLEKLSLTLGAVCAAMLGVPVVGFVVAPLFRKMKDTWIPVGNTDNFEVGKTVNVPFPDPSPLP